MTLGTQVRGIALAIGDIPGQYVPGACTPSLANPYCDNISDTLYNNKQLAAAHELAAVSGHNEIDNNGFNWVSEAGVSSACTKSGDATGCAVASNELYTVSHSDPVLANYSVTTDSHLGGAGSDCCFQDGTVCNHVNADGRPVGEKYADVLESHNYYQTPTEGNGVPDNATFYAETVFPDIIGTLLLGDGPWIGPTQSPSLAVTWLGHFPIAPLSGNGDTPQVSNGTTVPYKITTETGANIYLGGVTRDVQGKSQVNVLMDGILESWGDPNSGLSTFLYLGREGTQTDAGWGAYLPSAAMNASFNPASIAAGTTPQGIPGGDYLHNFTSLIADTASNNFTPTTPAGYSTTDNGATVHHQLMEKADGTYVLAVWGEAYQSKTQNSATVVIPSGRVGTLYDVTSPVNTGVLAKPAPVQSNLTGTVTIGLTDHMMVLVF